MKTLATSAIVLALATSFASAQTPQTTMPAVTPLTPAGQAGQVLTTMPAESLTVTHWYKQNVYDPGDNKIGEVKDVLVDKDGKIIALIVGAGGFLGMGEKDVAVPFNAVSFKTKGQQQVVGGDEHDERTLPRARRASSTTAMRWPGFRTAPPRPRAAL